VKLSDKSLTAFGWQPNREVRLYLVVSTGDEVRMDGRVSLSELLLNLVNCDKPKTLLGLSQTARSRYRFSLTACHPRTATGGKREPNPSFVIQLEHGKPVLLPLFFSYLFFRDKVRIKESSPQGTPIAGRVKEVGKS
jgi:hypothetical protein